MTQVLNFGSINIDHVYRLTEFVRPGETKPSKSYQCFAGGKGANQSVSLARAGVPVKHAGCIGQEGLWIKELLEKEGVDTTQLVISDTVTGHAIIQVTDAGENAIILHGGANQQITAESVANALACLTPSDIVVLQNEISGMAEILSQAAALKLRVFLNPAPMTSAVLDYPLTTVDHFIINEIEGEQLTGEKQPEAILNKMQAQFPEATVVLTLGSQGAYVQHKDERHFQAAQKVAALDTTGAGDTFTGYYIASRLKGLSLADSIATASKASAICVTRAGAAVSIPQASEVFG